MSAEQTKSGTENAGKRTSGNQDIREKDIRETGYQEIRELVDWLIGEW